MWQLSVYVISKFTQSKTKNGWTCKIYGSLRSEKKTVQITQTDTAFPSPLVALAAANRLILDSPELYSLKTI